MATVTRYTRAGKDGRRITCPKCGATHTVYHFSWLALVCLSCRAEVAKADWIDADYKPRGRQ